MQRYRFGRKIPLPATIAIKHQIRMLMAQDIKKAEIELVRKQTEGRKKSLVSGDVLGM
jgi:hypothetical protein